jgi:hypothetical protein
LFPGETGFLEGDFSRNDSCSNAGAEVLSTSTGAQMLSTFTAAQVFFTSTGGELFFISAGVEMFWSLEELPEGCLAL